MKAVLFLALLNFAASADSTGKPKLVNTLPDDQKSELQALGTTDVALQQALQKKMNIYYGLQITDFSKGGWLPTSTGKIGFKFQDADQSNTITFKCDFNTLHDTDASITNCSGTQSKNGKSISLAAFNKASANDPAQNAIFLKGILAGDANGTAGVPNIAEPAAGGAK